jgi:dual specificity protein kinase YAK1
MDALGHQELIECLSQNSGGSRSSSKPGSVRSYASHNGKSLHSLLGAHDQSINADLSLRSNHTRSNNTAASSAISQVDEAYRRLGQRLSSQAHGGVPHSSLGPKKVARLALSVESAFRSYEPMRRISYLEGHQQEDAGMSRTSKAQKINHSDHGNHQPSNQLLFSLKNITLNAKEMFQRCSLTAEPASLDEPKPESVEASSVALSRLDLAGSFTEEGSNRKQDWNHKSLLGRVDEGHEGESSENPWGTTSRKELLQNRRPSGLGPNGPHHARSLEPPKSSLNVKGLLSSVMEENASASSEHGGEPSYQSQTSRTISTKESSPRHHVYQQRGKCLTNPAEAASNDGYDNVEGNLIVHDNDILSIPKQAIKVLHHVSLPQDAEYRVVSLLGQGTFAQVFQCIHLQTSKVVAVKIVKNKPAYTRQAGMEVDVFRALQDEGSESTSGSLSLSSKSSATSRDYLVNLECYFFYRSHLCLVFEQLSLNLYEVLKQRQFRGLPLSVVRSIVHQVMVGLKDLSSKNVVHCDMKPENVLLMSDVDAKHVIDSGIQKNRRLRGLHDTKESPESDTGSVHPERSVRANAATSPKIKLIDFGSACFEGYSSHTYIQSRFYRSPEVLVGLPYDSGIDLWSMGCVAAELFLGLPILPGAHEHDQLARITEMISSLPDWMLDGGSKSPKYYTKFLVPRQTITSDSAEVSPPAPLPETPSPIPSTSASPAPQIPQWRLKTQTEYIRSLTSSEIEKKGGLAKLEKQPGNRYFKCKRLVDILSAHALSASPEDKELLPSFTHFLYGLLDPDPWKRWTALQAVQHPFLTGDASQLRTKLPGMKLDVKEENIANVELGVFWQCPWDPSICRRKLLSVQRLREKQHAMRRNVSGRHQGQVADFSFLQAEKRRLSRQPETPASAARQNVGLPGRFPVVHGGVSPGVKPSPATSSTGSLTVTLPPTRLNTAESGPSSALQGRSVSGDRSILDTASDAQFGDNSGSATYVSFSQESNLPLNHDFAFAIQRPGVVPGAGSIAGDASSLGSAAYSLSSMSHTGPDFFFEGKLPPHYPTTPSTQPLTQSNSITSNQSAHGPYVSQSFHFPNHHQMPLSGVNPSSDMSSVTMAEGHLTSSQYGQNFSSHANQQFPLQEHLWMHQHQQNNHQHRQQHQQGHSVQWQMQPQFQPIPMQQQPVYLATAPGGGFYYVTASATGQPILLQPVAVLDQPMTPLTTPEVSNGLDAPFVQGLGQSSLNLNMVPTHPQFSIHPAPPFTSQKFGNGGNHVLGHYAQSPSHAAVQRVSNASRPSKPTTNFRGGISM